MSAVIVGDGELSVEVLTVLMPLKNYHPAFLRESIASIFAQTHAAWKLLIIVEAADLTTFTELLATELADPRMTLVINQGRKLAGALNTGMQAATTSFVAILLSDDLWAPNAVQVLIDARRRCPDVDFFHSGRRMVDEAGRPLSAAYLPRESFALSDFTSGSPVKHLLCWRREMGLACGGIDESVTIGPDDYDFPWTMAEHGAMFRALADVLYIYRDHREAFRHTTHIPLSEQVEQMRHVMAKHSVAPATIRRRIAEAKRGFLKQCLYRNKFDRWLKVKLGFDPRKGWRERYK